MKLVTVVAFASFGLQDVEALEWQVPGTSGTVNFKDGDTKSFLVTDRAYDARIRPQLEKLEGMRNPVPTTDTDTPRGRTRPYLTYTTEEYTAPAALVDQVEGSPLDLSAPAGLVLKGRNLIRGTKAVGVVGSGTNQITFTAVRKGPQGNTVRVKLLPGGSASVTTTVNQDGSVDIVIVPTVAQQANLIAAQVTALAAQFVSAVAGGTAKLPIPAAGLPVVLSEGRGAGVAWAIFPSVLATSWLLVEGRVPGNGKNNVTVKIIAAGVGAVTVSGNDITVEPVTGSIGVADIATQINGNTAAAALVKATATGTSDISPVTHGKTYLAGGSGEDPVATIGGAVTSITSYTDTQIDLTVTNAALVAAGVTATDLASALVKAGPDVFGAQTVMQA